MTRNLLKLPFAGFFLAPIAAFGLGIGQIDVQSVLNQPLNAQIELLSATQEELSTISVDLASPQVFAEAGVDRPALLSGLQFTLQTRSNGNGYIQVSSKQPIREPLLNFLVEVDWAQGRLMREFVVLLEPRGTAVRRSAPAPAPVRPALPRPVEPLPQPSSALQFSGEIYGPVTRGETLWSIANRLRSDTSSSMQETMRWIVQANPHAFVGGDGNRLLVGTTLRVPVSEELSDHSAPEPRVEEAESSAPPLAIELPEQQPSVRLISSESEEVQSESEEVREEQLPATIQAIDTAEQASASAAPFFPSSFVIGLEDDHPRLRIAGLADLRLRIDALVGVDDAALSAAQTQPVSEPRQLTAVSEGVSNAPEAESATAESNITTAPVQPVASETADATVPTGTEGLEPASQQEEPSAEAAEPAPTREPGIMGRLRSVRNNPLIPVWVALGLLLLTALVVLLARGLKKKSVEDQQETGEIDFEPIVASNQPEAAPVNESVSPSLEKQPKPPPAVSSRQGVDPLERVDLLLAVGNFREAENTVRTALEENPSDPAVALKLLDVHYAAGNAQRFLEEAEMLRGRFDDGADPRWEQVKKMGGELCPGHPLFGEPAVAEVDKGPGGTDEKKAALDLEFEFPAQSDTPNVDFKHDIPIPNDDGDEALVQPFSDLDLEPNESKTLKPAAAKTEESKKSGDLNIELESLDFDGDKGRFSPKEGAEMQDAELKIEEREDAFESELKDLNFDFDQFAVQERDVEADINLPRPEGEADREISETMNDTGPDDYVETKLDLAVAYIDMDDHIGARSLLDEVLEEGNPDQEKKAEELLRNLS